MLADELREEIVYTVSKTGGHLSSSLGVTELTIALHHVFNTPEDKILWDVGHQVNPDQYSLDRLSSCSTLLDLCSITWWARVDKSFWYLSGICA